MKTSSKSSSQTSSSTTNVSRNLNIQDVEGITVGEAGGDVTVLHTDFNAIDRATDLAQKSLDVADSISRSGLSLALNQTETIADLARGTTQVVSDSTENALDKVTSMARDAVSFIGDFVEKLQGNAQTTLGSTVEALNKISVEQNKSSDQRLAEVSGNAVRYMVIAVGVLAGGAVLYAIFKRN